MQIATCAAVKALKEKPQAKEPKEKKPPRIFPCGCSEAGGRCAEEGRLYGWLEAAHRWGSVLEIAEARQAYQGHFDTGRHEFNQQERREWAKKRDAERVTAEENRN